MVSSFLNPDSSFVISLSGVDVVKSFSVTLTVSLPSLLLGVKVIFTTWIAVLYSSFILTFTFDSTTVEGNTFCFSIPSNVKSKLFSAMLLKSKLTFLKPLTSNSFETVSVPFVKVTFIHCIYL
ncbi:hypothetical protein PR256_02610 [Metamycoplasma hyosynoviae]|nr:hypothetical protein [Metamycoplasma hyosynoviae]MDC8917229.1 hypothetical protein [Metamycoplasma hyosynoviae]